MFDAVACNGSFPFWIKMENKHSSKVSRNIFPNATDNSQEMFLKFSFGTFHWSPKSGQLWVYLIFLKLNLPELNSVQFKWDEMELNWMEWISSVEMKIKINSLTILANSLMVAQSEIFCIKMQGIQMFTSFGS